MHWWILGLIRGCDAAEDVRHSFRRQSRNAEVGVVDTHVPRLCHDGHVTCHVNVRRTRVGPLKLPTAVCVSGSCHVGIGCCHVGD